MVTIQSINRESLTWLTTFHPIIDQVLNAKVGLVDQLRLRFVATKCVIFQLCFLYHVAMEVIGLNCHFCANSLHFNLYFLCNGGLHCCVGPGGRTTTAKPTVASPSTPSGTATAEIATKPTEPQAQPQAQAQPEAQPQALQEVKPEVKPEAQPPSS